MGRRIAGSGKSNYGRRLSEGNDVSWRHRARCWRRCIAIGCPVTWYTNSTSYTSLQVQRSGTIDDPGTKYPGGTSRHHIIVRNKTAIGIGFCRHSTLAGTRFNTFRNSCAIGNIVVVHNKIKAAGAIRSDSGYPEYPLLSIDGSYAVIVFNFQSCHAIHLVQHARIGKDRCGRMAGLNAGIVINPPIQNGGIEGRTQHRNFIACLNGRIVGNVVVNCSRANRPNFNTRHRVAETLNAAVRYIKIKGGTSFCYALDAL